MLRVTVELVPFGDETKKRKIAEMILANSGGHSGTSNYEGWISNEPWTGDSPRYGKVNYHDRQWSVWKLICSMIEACMPKFTADTKEGSLSQRLKSRLETIPEEIIPIGYPTEKKAKRR